MPDLLRGIFESVRQSVLVVDVEQAEGEVRVVGLHLRVLGNGPE